MFRFAAPQRTFQIGRVKIGGQPGELPTVLVGSIFYKGHRIIKDQQKGTFDKSTAEKLVKDQEELADITGNPCILDVVVSSVGAIEKQLDFISTVTDTPIIFDAWPLRVRTEGLCYLREIGLTERIIYNSISPATRQEEVEAIKEAKVRAAILLAYDFSNPWAAGLLAAIRGSSKKKGLLTLAEEADITKPLVDNSVTSLPSIGISARAIWIVKNEFGYPAGCGAANATTRWKMPKKKWGDATFKACSASAQTATLVMGADFLMYGPIESSSWIFPAAAAIDSIVATAAKELGTEPATREHPIYKLFPKISKEMEKR